LDRLSLTGRPGGLGPVLTDRVIDVYENERWSRKKRAWVPSREPPSRAPWTTKDGKALPPPDDTEPLAEYGWVSNWKVDATGGKGMDEEGWEYATSFDKLGRERVPRGEQRWSDRARRRRWMRVMRHKTLLDDVKAAQELTAQVQEGLKGLVKGRKMVQEMVDTVGSRRDSLETRRELFVLIEMVRKHAAEVDALIRSIDKERVPAVKKLSNDLAREQRQFLDLIVEAERRDRTVPPPVPSSASMSNGTSNGPGAGAGPRTGEGGQGPGAGGGESKGGGRAAVAVAGKTTFRPAPNLSLSLAAAPAEGRGGEEGRYLPRDTQEDMILQQMVVSGLDGARGHGRSAGA
jgi:hypothetical protein